jgi:hypothetical protein
MELLQFGISTDMVLADKDTWHSSLTSRLKKLLLDHGSIIAWQLIQVYEIHPYINIFLQLHKQTLGSLAVWTIALCKYHNLRSAFLRMQARKFVEDLHQKRTARIAATLKLT